MQVSYVALQEHCVTQTSTEKKYVKYGIRL